MGFGGAGLTSMCVCDLDGDSQLELAFVYSWGSGIHRSHPSVLSLDKLTPVHIEAKFHPLYDIVLEKVDDQIVRVYVDAPGNRGTKGHRILVGRLRLSRHAQRVVLDILFDPGLAKEWRQGI